MSFESKETYLYRYYFAPLNTALPDVSLLSGIVEIENPEHLVKSYRSRGMEGGMASDGTYELFELSSLNGVVGYYRIILRENKP